MRRVEVRLRNRRYEILIGKNLIRSIGLHARRLRLGSKILVVTQKRIGRHFLGPVVKSLRRAGFEVFTDYAALRHQNERDKNEASLVRLWQRMAAIPLHRDSAVVALGGGVVGDVSGFAAATYMRGISLIQVPTTLLAQVDSSIGGKTAIDLAAAKNIVGAFYQPRLVLADLGALETLAHEKSIGPRELRNAFAEIIKYGVTSDPELFRLLEREANGLLKRFTGRRFRGADYRLLGEIVWRSARAKAEIVGRDEYETKGERMILNFGHTFGHAFEAASKYRMAHGEAVAAGMGAASRLSARLGLLAPAVEKRIHELIASLGLPVNLRSRHLRREDIFRAMDRDKKRKEGTWRFVLPLRIGKVAVRKGIDRQVVAKILSEIGVR